ncbi:hypothetical protein FUA48_05755 [Flavobacterium alkalisoli]|uniref:Uncharacterized protein n=1 Tax=Flavobacterium alkalisoli TaxID=2602769 RepID=A0A5B9FWK8_9FLAO|nr:hypothetical protein [Flavobacterium alkalisoli]QEE49102.1 hypothetical protein FUA48_05755 [Flavobacterium alkalisoli]
MKDNKNLEQQLAEKLGNRSIAPSAQAWDRIAQNRQQGKDKKKKKRVTFYYAASVVLVLLSGGYFFVSGNNKDVVTEPQVVVDSGKTEIINKGEEPVIISESVLQLQQNHEVVAYKEEKLLQTDFVQPREEVKVIARTYRNIQVNESLPEVNVAALQDVKLLTREELYEQEVDYLLKNAVKEMATDKLLKAPTDDTALLREVELEMNDYYREKAMKIFSLQNRTIRIAVKDKQ